MPKVFGNAIVMNESTIFTPAAMPARVFIEVFNLLEVLQSKPSGLSYTQHFQWLAKVLVPQINQLFDRVRIVENWNPYLCYVLNRSLKELNLVADLSKLVLINRRKST